MSLRLLLLRHAKSSWSDATASDFDRPLNRRGREAAPLVAAHMHEIGLQPRRVLCSTALRTRETLALTLPAFRHPHEIELLRDLYDTPADTYLDIIRRHGHTAETLLVIGHNPLVQDTALDLAASGDPQAIRAIEEKFPTAALAILDFPELGVWDDLRPGTGHLDSFTVPRALNADGSGAGD